MTRQEFDEIFKQSVGEIDVQKRADEDLAEFADKGSLSIDKAMVFATIESYKFSCDMLYSVLEKIYVTD